MKKNWIAEATKNKGGLHKQLGIKEGEKIPKKILIKSSKAKGKLGARARLALTLSKFKK